MTDYYLDYRLERMNQSPHIEHPWFLLEIEVSQSRRKVGEGLLLWLRGPET
jgi:hypothetical protein